jgi:HPt (histidine-containing phosphotransfer) domain-containing protein
MSTLSLHQTPSRRVSPVTANPNTSDPNPRDPADRQTAPTAASKVLDLDGLLHRCMGDIDLVQRVLEKFQQRVPEELAEIEKALQAGNAEQLARTAHRLKGSSATVSAEGLVSAAAEIEDAGRQGRMADAADCLTRLHNEWKKLVELRSDSIVGR